MIHVLEGGTDAAAMTLFDPDALPEDFDEKAREDPSAALREAADAGRLLLLEAGGDGRHGLGVCVGEGLPDDVAPLARPLGDEGRLVVAGDSLLFAGVEYAFRRDDARLRRRPHMGEACEVPPGAYRVRLFEADYPASFFEDRLRARASEAGLRLDSLMARRLLPMGSLGTIAGVVGLVGLGWDAWRVSVLPAALAMVLPALVVSRLRAYREAAGARRGLPREAPARWAVLEPADASGWIR